MGFVLLAPEVFRFYAGRDFWDGIVLIPLFSAGYYLNFLCTFPVNFDYYHKKNKAVAIITISCAVVNIGLNYLLIRQFGVVGAAMATMTSHLLQLTMHHIYAAHILGTMGAMTSKQWQQVKEAYENVCDNLVVNIGGYVTDDINPAEYEALLAEVEVLGNG